MADELSEQESSHHGPVGDFAEVETKSCGCPGDLRVNERSPSTREQRDLLFTCAVDCQRNPCRRGRRVGGRGALGVRPALQAEPLGFATGIYVVSLTDHPGSVDGSLSAAPISLAAVDKLLDARPELTLDGQRPDREQLAARLAGFWFPDEVVVHIGLAGPRASRPRQGEVARRVEEYYKTPLGARTPHAGGWPLKTLVSLSKLHVHYAYCRDVEIAEDASIRHFADHVSDATRERLYDPVRVMPFANLEFPKGNSKNHGIRGARAPRRSRSAQPATGTRRRQAAKSSPVLSAPTTSATSAVVPHHPSQKVTSKDIEVGAGPHPHRGD